MDARGPAAHGCRAEVVADGRRIRYGRCGAGRPLVLLGAAELPSPLAAELTEALAAAFRVFEPEVVAGAPAEGSGGLEWLVPFLDGLGLLGAGLVAAGSFRTAAGALVRDAPEHVSRVVLLDGGPCTGGTTGAAADGSVARLLRVDASLPDRRALLSCITAFLSSRPARPPLDRTSAAR